jgi:hypothetical protein
LSRSSLWSSQRPSTISLVVAATVVLSLDTIGLDSNTKQKLSTSSDTPCEHPSLYRCLVGALQYLTFTQPDISYAIQQVFSTYIHAPYMEHMLALKRSPRYVQDTIHFGLHLSPSPILHRLSHTLTLIAVDVPTPDAAHLATVFSR